MGQAHPYVRDEDEYICSVSTMLGNQLTNLRERLPKAERREITCNLWLVCQLVSACRNIKVDPIAIRRIRNNIECISKQLEAGVAVNRWQERIPKAQTPKTP